MRWDGQQLGTEEPAALPGLAKLNNLVRSVQTPDFAGVTFHEVLAKSALNKVPRQSQMPFGWTINPYRGCSHACVYCLDPSTLILMGDGRHKPLRDVTVGDEIVGTELHDSSRRYVNTAVLATWKTVKRAHRVSLADGTTIVASGDHRFLTERGWAYVRPGQDGTHRPTLALGESLLGLSLDATGGARGSSITGATVEGAEARLQVLSIEDLGSDIDMIDITTGTGDFIANGVISHNCFARPTHSYLDFNAGDDFDNQVVVKINVAEVLAKEVARPSWGKYPVALGTNTDPYQRAEGRYSLMPGIIESLAHSGTPLSILTKGTLLRRDLPLLADVAQTVPVDLAMSIAIYDDELQKSIEPGTPSAKARLATVTAVRNAGLDCSVFLMPILPYLTDTKAHLDEALRRVKEAGGSSVLFSSLYLKPGVKPWFMHWLQRQHPELVPKYTELYSRGQYAPKEYRAWLANRISPLIRAHGLERGREDPATGGIRSKALGMMRNDAGERVAFSSDDGSTGARVLPSTEQPMLF
jgi:DNA repair photolyase